MATLLRRVAAGDSAFCPQVDVSVSNVALGLIFSWVVHRWENFTECFPVFCKEEGDRAQGVFNTLSRHMESSLVVSLYFPMVFFGSHIVPGIDGQIL